MKYPKCPVKDCPIGLSCSKACYWWNENSACDWTKEAEAELEAGTKRQLDEYQRKSISNIECDFGL